ncbi:MAG: hypothetical protein FWC92_10050, partial [Defluviitaleaceae bacterium]|nr:hypothetical protein [Defluviitaleaceae bacterium]
FFTMPFLTSRSELHFLQANMIHPISFDEIAYHISILSTTHPLDIAMDQVNILRIQSITNYIQREKNGMYLQIGDSAAHILRNSTLDPAHARQVISQSLPEHQATHARDYITTLSKPSLADFKIIMRHGYEVARCVSLVSST